MLLHRNYITPHIVIVLVIVIAILIVTVIVIAIVIVIVIVVVREDINTKKMLSFGHCPNEGRGGSPHARIIWPFLRSAFLVNKKSLFLQKC